MSLMDTAARARGTIALRSAIGMPVCSPDGPDLWTAEQVREAFGAKAEAAWRAVRAGANAFRAATQTGEHRK